MRTLRLLQGALCAALLLAGCGRVHLGTHDAGGGDEDAGAIVQCGPTVCGLGTVCCNASCGICAAPGAECPAIACAEDCGDNADCAPTAYCARPAGTCGGEGTCVPRPTACPPVIREVCGCDGVTYSSPCDANALGANVSFDGACTTPCDAQDIEGQGACALALGVRWNGVACESFSGCACAGADCDRRFTSMSACEAHYADCMSGGCASNAECPAGRYCHFESGCGGAGECRAIPGELPCSPAAQPVCGCDGLDYACEDAAHQSGVSVFHAGTCGDECAPMDATGVGACFLHLGVKWNGAACESVGGCTCEGADCARITEWETREECEAAHAGCARVCGGFLGAVCLESEFCDFPDPHYCGGADETGVCRPRPSGCPDVIDPVCGCDGAVHDNECMAHAAGVDTRGDPSTCGAP